jgi:hypothetical protein
MKKRRVPLAVEQLEARATPTVGAFVPPGLTRFLAESSEAPPPVQISREGSIAFVPPGMTRFFGESSEAPPPIHVTENGSVGFVPPGVIKGFNPQPDPPGQPAPFIVANG